MSGIAEGNIDTMSTTLKKLTALLGTGALLFAFAGTAFAATGASDQGVTPTLVDGANITLDGNGNSDQADCAAADGLETGDEGGEGTTESGVTVTWTYDAESKEFGFTATGGVVLIAYVKGGDAYNVYDYSPEGVTSDGGMFAPDNASGGPAGLSHAVFCTAPGSEPSFEQSEEAETDAPSDVPSFEQSEAADTDAPSEPQTDAISGTGNSAPADGAWLLVVALGVLLASIVVLTPARAKGRR
jgi:hypothetical protein